MGGKVSFPIVQLPADRICVVTGANTGIGYEVAKWLAMMGARVILACRSEDKAVEAIRRMDTEYKDLKEKGTEGLADLEQLQLEYMHLDLSSFQSVKDFVGAFKLSGRQLHVLICNAGVCKAKLETTDDGFESMLQVNYLGHFLLIGQLLPVMKKSDSDDVRIVLVSSDMHRWPKYDLSQMNYSGDPAKYSMFTCYGNSKLYQVMQMYSLQRRLKNTNISITSVHPGDVDTEIGRDYVDSKTWQLLLRFSRLIGTMRTPIEGANSVLYAAVHPDLKGVSGKYFKDCKDGYTTAAARDEVKQEALWKQTLAYLKDHLMEEDIFCLEGADPEAENT